MSSSRSNYIRRRMQNIVWNDEVVLDCPYHGWACTDCGHARKVKFSEASDRTQRGIRGTMWLNRSLWGMKR